MKKNKPFTFVATKKPFKVQINLKQGMVVTGYSYGGFGGYFRRFTKPVPVHKGDVFRMDQQTGCGQFILNGKSHPVKMRLPKKVNIKMGWTAKRLRMAVFSERDKIWRPGCKDHGKLGKLYWCAMDTRSYWVGTGATADKAIAQLIDLVKFTDLMAKEERKKGNRVIRWHVEREPGVAKEFQDAERKARKTGFILEGVDWEKSFAKI